MYNYGFHGQESQCTWHYQGQSKHYVNISYRSRNSLSLMHHASAAGSRTTTVARSPVPAQSMHTSSAAVRQPLTKLDINQQQQHYRQTQSADSPRDGGQAEAGCPVSMSTELHKCHHDNHAAHYNQQWQQQQQQNKLQVELPAGIPLTPVLSQKAQPRDSLEASIWKLSCSQEKQQMPPKNAFGPQEQNKPQKGAGGMYGLQPNRQQPISHDKSLHMVRDSLEATLHKLAASQ
jgi:hypothetical protein